MKLSFPSLQPREKNLILFGTTLIVLLLWLMFIILPMKKTIHTWNNTLSSLDQLTQFVHRHTQQLDALKHQGYEHILPTSAQQLNTVIQQNFISHHLTTYHPTLSTKTTGIEVRFSQVPFDDLIQALHSLSSQHTIDILSAQFQRTKTQGIVHAQFRVASRQPINT